ncbi:hypothetical protein [Pseudarthrobacter sp. NamE5]|uniref:hypothetical protein n=1 Tax=Pseudarthrobacter sp. NamE5 TaxID=2576839 RepID=UPI001486B87A|nr:hypothetical protein [Pseudarthrobacter sp. NamE5]
MGSAWAADYVSYPVLDSVSTAMTSLNTSLPINGDVAELEQGIAAEEAREHGHIQRVHAFVL